MHRLNSGRSIEGMRLSSFLHYQQNRGNPFQRRRLKGGPPCWATPSGKIIWLEQHQTKHQPAEYRLRTGTPEDFRKTPLIQRGVRLLDYYLPPRKPDTPLLKRKIQALQQINAQAKKYLQPLSRTSRNLQARKIDIPKALLQPRKSPISNDLNGHHLSARKAELQTPRLKALGSARQDRDLRLYETVKEITYGDLPDRISHFLRRAAKETPVSLGQTENRWFGLNKKGLLVMTKSSWLSRFFPNHDIQRFIKFYNNALDKRMKTINQIRWFHKLSPINVSALVKERHCHAEVLQKQLDEIAQINNSDFQRSLADCFCDLSKLLSYHPDAEGQIPPAIREQVMKTSSLVLDWINCSTSQDIRNITGLYLSWVKSLRADPILTSKCPHALKTLCRSMPTMLQDQIHGRKAAHYQPYTTRSEKK